MRRLVFIPLCVMAATSVEAEPHAHMQSDPLLAKLMIDRLEVRDVEGPNPVKWDIQGWLGGDLRKLWLKSEGRYVDGETAAAELQVLYDRAVSPYWNVQAGWRGDLEPDPQRDWFTMGLRGLAPYFIDLDVSLFFGEGGRSALRIKTDYEWKLARRWILSPDLEANAYGEDDAARGTGSGLSDAQIGLRLRYQVTRHISPYVGVEGRRRFGATEDFVRTSGKRADNAWWLAGVSVWY